MRILPPPPPGRVLGLYATPGADVYYRLVAPLSAIGGASWASWEEVTEEQLRAAEVAVISRLGGRPEDVSACIEDLKGRWGIRTVLADFDDAWFYQHDVPEVRVAPEALVGVLTAVREVDGLVVQNDMLLRHFRQYTDKPIAVVPNLILPETWPAEPPPESAPPTVVLAGSQSHRLDWSLVLPALRWLRERAPDVQLRVMGCQAHELKELATEEAAWTMDLPTYVGNLAGGAIGLCPLPATGFNQGKSPVKAIEYSLAAGMAVIGSPTQYGPLLAQGRGLVVPDEDPSGWAKCLAFYLANPERRRADAGRLRSWVGQQYDARQRAARLRRVYDTPGGAEWHCS